MLDESRRKESERQFHNERYGGEVDIRQHLDKWYTALAAGTRKHNALVKRFSRGGDVLEYGCADGIIAMGSYDIPHDFKHFTGIDISDKAIESARETARERGITNAEFMVMDAENMTFPDNSFDIVFGSGILHHLDLNKCFSEIARVLKPGGKAVFSEPMGHNMALNYYRSKTPHLRTPDEHPFLMKDLDHARNVFGRVDCEFFGLTTLAAVPFRNTALGTGLMKMGELADKVILRVPLVRRNAWTVLMTMTKSA